MVFTATAAILLDGEGFNRLVAEEDLRTWQQGGYIYTKRKGKNGIEIYRTYSEAVVLWTYRQVCTQDNVAGGSLVCTVTPAAGTAYKIIEAIYTASGTRAIACSVKDVDTNNHIVIASAAASAGCNVSFPNIGTAASASGNVASTIQLVVAGGSYVALQVTSAAQTETATIACTLELIGGTTAPTVSWATSAGTPNAAAATENTVVTIPRGAIT